MSVEHKSNTYFQYFWIKVEKKEEVDARRKRFLEKANASGVYHPMGQGVVPRPPKKILPQAFGQLFSVNLGLHMNPDMLEKKGLAMDIVAIDPGYDLATVQNWINEPEEKGGGREWAGDAFVVLSHVCIESI